MDATLCTDAVYFRYLRDNFLHNIVPKAHPRSPYMRPLSLALTLSLYDPGTRIISRRTMR